MKGVGNGSFVFEIDGSERIIDEMSVDVVLQIVELLFRIAQGVFHDGQSLIELAKISLGEVKDVKAFVHLLFWDACQHGVAPMEVGTDTFRVLPFDIVQRDAVPSQLFLQLCDRFFPALA